MTDPEYLHFFLPKFIPTDLRVFLHAPDHKATLLCKETVTRFNLLWGRGYLRACGVTAVMILVLVLAIPCSSYAQRGIEDGRRQGREKRERKENREGRKCRRRGLRVENRSE